MWWCEKDASRPHLQPLCHLYDISSFVALAQGGDKVHFIADISYITFVAASMSAHPGQRA